MSPSNVISAREATFFLLLCFFHYFQYCSGPLLSIGPISDQNIKSPIHWPFVRGHWSPVNCNYKGSVMQGFPHNYNDVIMSAIASQITSLTIVYSTVYSGTNQRKHQSSASLAFVMGIHRWPVNSPHKGPVARQTFPFNDVIMSWCHYDNESIVSHTCQFLFFGVFLFLNSCIARR